MNDLAPLHNPPALAAIDALSHLSPNVPAVACFDTAFHTSLKPAASSYALPRAWVERWGLRRYGFHGLSCEWSVGRAAALLERPVGSPQTRDLPPGRRCLSDRHRRWSLG